MAFEPSEGLYAGLSFVPTSVLTEAKSSDDKFKELYFVALENLKSDKVLDAAGNATKNGMIKIIDLNTWKLSFSQSQSGARTPMNSYR